ncbi:MAG: MBL fold metallo-hydrolase [Mycobacteriaceae bacterium]
MDDVTVRRVDFDYFVRPPEEIGTGEPREEPCLGYLVVHPEGTLLFDTGMGGDPSVGQHYRPRRTGPELALSTVDVSVDDIDLVANCHLHFDHCGGNAFFAGKPILSQGTELVAARAVVDYTLAELIDTPGRSSGSGLGRDSRDLRRGDRGRPRGSGCGSWIGRAGPGGLRKADGGRARDQSR